MPSDRYCRLELKSKFSNTSVLSQQPEQPSLAYCSILPCYSLSSKESFKPFKRRSICLLLRLLTGGKRSLIHTISLQFSDRYCRLKLKSKLSNTSVVSRQLEQPSLVSCSILPCSLLLSKESFSSTSQVGCLIYLQ